ncbi:GSCFA domain-containing protein [Halovulum sp. GXIMD14794]
MFRRVRAKLTGNHTPSDLPAAGNPYEGLPATSFWKRTVAEGRNRAFSGIWVPRAPIDRTTRIATYGSCFAQHFSRRLVKRGFQWLDMESAPSVATPEVATTYNYGIYSSRTGNIYTAASLRQWLEWADVKSVGDDEAWQEGDRWYDPFRPAIEPNGFSSREELMNSRRTTIRAFRKSAKRADLFVFTLGLTEAWVNKKRGTIYPVCPGTVAGNFDASEHVFENFDYVRVLDDMRAAIAVLRRINPDTRVLLTVSPVPLTATATNQHVLVATTYSKSVLRAVAGTLQAELDCVDYFPSYEIVTSSLNSRDFFAENKRSVTADGVDFVMARFFECIGEASEELISPAPDEQRHGRPRSKARSEDRLTCEEELLEAFSKPAGR